VYRGINPPDFSLSVKAYLPNWIHTDYEEHCRAGLISLVLTQLSATVRIDDFFRGETEKYTFG